MSFRAAVEATPAVRDAYRSGLRALRGGDRAAVGCREPRKLAGSINLDEALKAARPNDTRWDYGIGFRADQAEETVYWVEIHPASASRHVDDVVRKVEWLRAWLKSEAPALDGLRREYVWVATGTVCFTPGAPGLRRLAQSGVRFEPRRLSIGPADRL